VVDPTGKELAFIATGPPNQTGLIDEWRGIPSNVEFGIGDDSNTLYVTIDKSLYRIRLKTRGFHLPNEKGGPSGQRNAKGRLEVE
jgi:hypothetical protein